MTVKKTTPGTIDIANFVFAYGVSHEVSDSLGGYIKENFSNIFEIVESKKEEKPAAPKRTTRKKKPTGDE
jgi:hypothetical protein